MKGVLNVLWLITFGWILCLLLLIFGALCCITIIGFRFGLEVFHLAFRILLPFNNNEKIRKD